MPEGLSIWTIAACAAIAIVAAFLVYTAATRGPEDTVAVALMRSIARLYSRLVHRVRVIGEGSDPVPPGGAYILVSNHRSGVDPIIVSIVTQRRICFLMAREYYEVPILHHAFRALDAIPVNRDGNDLGATKAALKRLHAGKVVGIFPQGGIRDATSEIEGKAGAALLALRTGAPVIPLFIDGSPNTHSVLRAVLTPSRTTVRFGPPIALGHMAERRPTRAELEEVNSRILGAISSLAGAGDQGAKEVTGISASRACAPSPAASAGQKRPGKSEPADRGQAL